MQTQTYEKKVKISGMQTQNYEKKKVQIFGDAKLRIMRKVKNIGMHNSRIIDGKKKKVKISGMKNSEL